MVVNKIIEKLMDTGLSEYEARAYLGILGKHPATAYEAAKASGIPTSKIYGVIAKLEEKGILSVLGGGKTKKYIPVDPEEFIESRRAMMEETLKGIKQGFMEAKSDTDVSYIWNLKEYGHLMDKAGRIIKDSSASLVISIWGEEMEHLTDAIKEAEARSVKVSIVHFGVPRKGAGLMFQHPIHDTIYAEKGGRGLVIVGDSKHAIMGTIQKDGSAEGAYSTNKGFVTLAEDYIKHDIYVMKIVKRFDRELVRTFGRRYEKLRDVYTDEEETSI